MAFEARVFGDVQSKQSRQRGRAEGSGCDERVKAANLRGTSVPGLVGSFYAPDVPCTMYYDGTGGPVFGLDTNQQGRRNIRSGGPGALEGAKRGRRATELAAVT